MRNNKNNNKVATYIPILCETIKKLDYIWYTLLAQYTEQAIDIFLMYAMPFNNAA